MINCTFVIEESYQDAIKNTDDGLVPLAVRIATLNIDELYPDKNIEHGSTFNPVAFVAMTTVFNIPKYNGKFGWYNLDADLKRKIGDYIMDLPRQWYFLSQRFEEG